MALLFPSNPTNGDKVILGGKEYRYSGTKWRRHKSVIIDSGSSGASIVLDDETVDGGGAGGI